jgi:predicted esterase
MANHIKAQSKACPQQKYVIGGHSQGGTVTHSAISTLAKSDPVALAKIIAITTFGDPNSGEALPAVLKGREKYNCLKGDVVSTPYRVSYVTVP